MCIFVEENLLFYFLLRRKNLKITIIMTKEQIEIYEYGKKYLLKLEDYKKNLPFKSQEFGCGSGRPSIEFQLENIHKIMYEAVFNAMHSAGESVNKIIEEL